MQFTLQIERDAHSVLEVSYDSPRQHIIIYKEDKPIFLILTSSIPEYYVLKTHCRVTPLHVLLWFFSPSSILLY